MAWDAALKMTEVKLELITKEDQYLFLEVINQATDFIVGMGHLRNKYADI